MQETDAVITARRDMEVCNACRYCEGFCAVFPALELRREFSTGDLSYLANLCHNCRGCYYACQYAPPHEWGINVPRALAEVRAESYAEYAWPKPLATAFNRNGTLVSLIAALAIAVVLILSMLLNTPGNFFGAHPVVADSFYRVIPLWAMNVVALATFGFSLFALWMGARNFWHEAGPQDKVSATALAIALWDVLTLKNLGGGGNGCNDASERFSMRRRYLHHAMFYGFLLCFASTSSAFIYHAFLGWPAPYPFISLPVLLGTVGGVLLMVGTVGLFAMKFVDDPMPAVRRLLGADVALLMLLAMIALTGLILLAVRATGAMGLAMAVHLGFILALFLVLPYSKMVHGVYRSAALLRRAVERNMKPLGGE
ncbi:tricarballylate utilization 4Fe-4S protein TcuB [Rhodopila sp.]|uniref:tricarballylate utilization 4Fe-4S protein TcuB n=1 Tax=Rhodopila sp. TaxID=2480087 RepID=UPI003D0B3F61